MNDVSLVQPAAAAPKASGAFFVETVTWVHHWTDTLFSFRCTRDPGLRFSSGQFLMVGLQKEDGKPLVRAYSVASPSWHEELEFYSIKVPDGPLTSRLQHLKVGDKVLIGRKPTGTLVLDGLKPGKRLYMLGTGTGLAPWLSLAPRPRGLRPLRDRRGHPHRARGPGPELRRAVREGPQGRRDPVGADRRQAQVLSDGHPREVPHPGPHHRPDRFGQLFRDLGLPPFNPAEDRVMLCGGPSVLADLKQQLLDMGYVEGSLAQPGDFVLERAFVET